MAAPTASPHDGAYPFEIDDAGSGPAAPLVDRHPAADPRGRRRRAARGARRGSIARRFHSTLVEIDRRGLRPASRGRPGSTRSS